MSAAIPTLRTERLLLRAPEMADFASYAAMMVSRRSVHMGGPFDERGAWLSFCQDVAMWPLFGHGALMIDRLADSRCIGQVGINHGPLFPEKELGWLLYAGFEGQGYASEAAAALRDWAFAELKLPTLVSYCDPANTASQAVARRLGGVVDPAAARQDPEDLVFRYRRGM
ncbi:GNAT family N-acetyltransferase [Devosia sp. 1566]|uniref:GNAT family N-acetyltransferase n=1 Tax=Devosia sp. 1566 TaxID=2499144 RepID=UPI000FD71B49|nr:GNAT family N-acetyltransferase [Devosia sp. 1566]